MFEMVKTNIWQYKLGFADSDVGVGIETNTLFQYLYSYSQKMETQRSFI